MRQKGKHKPHQIARGSFTLGPQGSKSKTVNTSPIKTSIISVPTTKYGQRG